MMVRIYLLIILICFSGCNKFNFDSEAFRCLEKARVCSSRWLGVYAELLKLKEDANSNYDSQMLEKIDIKEKEQRALRREGFGWYKKAFALDRTIFAEPDLRSLTFSFEILDETKDKMYREVKTTYLKEHGYVSGREEDGKIILE